MRKSAIQKSSTAFTIILNLDFASSASSDLWKAEKSKEKNSIVFRSHINRDERNWPLSTTNLFYAFRFESYLFCVQTKQCVINGRMFYSYAIMMYRPGSLVQLPLNAGDWHSLAQTHIVKPFFSSYLFFILLFSHWPQRDTRQPTSFICVLLPMQFTSLSFDAVVRRAHNRELHTQSFRAHVCANFVLSFHCAANDFFLFTSYTFWAGQWPEWMNATRTKVIDATGMCECVCVRKILNSNQKYLFVQTSDAPFSLRRLLLASFPFTNHEYLVSSVFRYALGSASDWISSACH